MKITPDEVLEAYATTGMRPLARAYYKPGCACPLMALAMAKGYRPSSRARLQSLSWRLGAATDAERLYLASFLRGWDHAAYELRAPAYIEGRTDPDLIGYQHGIDAFKAVSRQIGVERA